MYQAVDPQFSFRWSSADRSQVLDPSIWGDSREQDHIVPTLWYRRTCRARDSRPSCRLLIEEDDRVDDRINGAGGRGRDECRRPGRRFAHCSTAVAVEVVATGGGKFCQQVAAEVNNSIANDATSGTGADSIKASVQEYQSIKAGVLSSAPGAIKSDL